MCGTLPPIISKYGRMMEEHQNSNPLLAPKIVYGLYLAGFFVGISPIAGLIYAYIARGKDAVADTHLRFLINTFWTGLAIAIVGFISFAIGIGFIILMALGVWFLMRLISGFVLIMDKKPISSTKALGFLAQ